MTSMRGAAASERSKAAPTSIALFYLVSLPLVNAEALAAFLKARLSSDRTRDDWRRVLEGAWEHLLSVPLETFLGSEVDAVVEAHLTRERIVDAVRPGIRLWLESTLVEARKDDRPIGRWVPAEAKAKMLELASRKGFVDPRWVEHIFQQKAMEDVITDTLYQSLRDFSTIIPRLVASLTPSILGRIASIGTSVGSKIVDEIERRLEPEIRKFLDKGGRKALDGAARFTIDHLDDPVSIEARKNTVLFALAQSPAFHVAHLDDEMVTAIDEIAEAIALSVADDPETRAIAKSVLDRLRQTHGPAPVRAWLEVIGLRAAPPFEAWAAVSWPYLKTILASPACEAFLDQLAEEAVAGS